MCWKKIDYFIRNKAEKKRITAGHLSSRATDRFLSFEKWKKRQNIGIEGGNGGSSDEKDGSTIAKAKD